MARRTTVVCVSLGLMSPIGVYALGLGDIEVRSSLNQPLRAEVQLISAAPGELEDLEVSLAPRATFERLGLDRPAFLSGLEFDVGRDERGEPVVRVTSTRPVSEPFLTFLLEAQWSRGRLLREYTVLLDPPVYQADDAAPPPARAQTASLPERDAAAAGPVTRGAQAAEPAASPTPGETPRAASGRTAMDEYGPVERNQTLWTIANTLRAESGASVNQMMIALYRANPDAFGDNINVLRAGAVLQVPDAGALEAVAAGEADAEVARQYAAWRDERQAAAAPPSGRDASAGRLRLVPPAEEAGAEAEAGRPGPAAEGAAVSGDEAESLRREVADLQTRLGEAERLLELKDSELAALQGRLSELQSVGDEPREVAADGATASGVELEAEPAAPEPAVQPAPAAQPATTGPRPATIGEPEGAGTGLAAILASTWLYVALGIGLLLAALLLFARRRRAVEDVAGRWRSLDEDADADERAAPAAQVATTQRLRTLPEADESIVVVEQGPGTAGRRPPAARSREPAPVATSAEEDDTLSSASAVHLDQADTLAEADFHMAYGLYDQAAELVQKAAREEPARRDLRMKLLEIYFVWGNEQAFLEEARQLHDSLHGQPDEDWDKVLIMGKQICPDEALFGAEPGAAGGRSGDVDLDLADSGADDSTIDFDTRDEAQPEAGLDLDLGGAGDRDQSLKGTARRRAGPTDSDMLDFELTDDEPEVHGEAIADDGSRSVSDTVETPTLEQPAPDSPTVESPTLESARYEDETVETPTIEQRVESARSAGGTDQTAEIDLDDLGLDLEDLRDDSLDSELGDEEETLLADMSGFDSRRAGDETGSEDFDAALTTPAGRARDTDATSEVPYSDRSGSRSRDVDATSEMAALDSGDLDLDLEDLSAALESSDTAEHPRPAGGGDTVRQQRPSSRQARYDGDEFVDADVTELISEEADSFAATGVSGGPDFDLDDIDESEVESEIGTKLDLARAYMDMGDPDGASSILQEVLEAGDSSQREEAQRLLDALPS